MDDIADITITKLNEAYIKLEFANDGIARELSEILTFDVPGAKFSPAFKKRHWDGKIRLFDARTSTLFAGLNQEVHNFARELDYTVDDQSGFDIKREFSLAEAHDFYKSLGIPDKFTLREYQLRAFALAIRNRRATLISPTASGKSLIAYLIARYHNTKTLIVVPTTGLVLQMVGDFKEYGYTGTVHGVMGGVQKHTDEDITVSTWQSIYEQPPEFFEEFGLIIGDEAHNYKAKSLIGIMTKMTNTPERISMTGTLDGAAVNELTITGLFGPVEKIVTTKQLMEDKHIADLKIKLLILKHPTQACKNLVGKTYQEELEYIIGCEARNRFIKNLALSLKGNTLILFSYVEKHGKQLFEMIKAKHPNTYFVAGEVDADVREYIRKLVETHDDIKIVASFGTFSTGTNMKRLNNMIFASPGKSRIRTMQSLGRGLRLGEGKLECTLFDIADEISYKKKRNYTLNHMIERVKMYNSEGFNYSLHTIELN